MRSISDTSVNDRYRVPKPKSLKEVPKYLKALASGFFSRLFYIFRLVWDTKKSLLFIMVFMAVFNGIMPVIGSVIGAQIINRLADAYSGALLTFGVIAVLLVLQFAYTFINQAVTRLYATVTSISGEQVSNHVKMLIMDKAKEALDGAGKAAEGVMDKVQDFLKDAFGGPKDEGKA